MFIDFENFSNQFENMETPTFEKEESFHFNFDTPFEFLEFKEITPKQSQNIPFVKDDDFNDIFSTLVPFNSSGNDSPLLKVSSVWKDSPKNIPDCYEGALEDSFKAEEVLEEPKNIQVDSNPKDVQESFIDQDYLVKEFSQVVSDSLKNEPDIGNKLSYRKDVVYKFMLRTFRKAISQKFRVKIKRPSRTTKPIEEIKEQIMEEAENKGIINIDDPEQNTEEFRELVWWMAISKMTHRSRPLFNLSNHAIDILSDILKNYSHAKLILVYQNKHIAKIYRYFMKHCLKSSLEKCPKHKQAVYIKAAFDMAENFI